MSPPVAHATHWVTGLLYLAPVLVLAAAVLWQRLKARNGDTAGDDR